MTAQLDLALGDGLRAQSSGPLDSSRGTSVNTTPNWQLCTSTPLVKRVEGMQTVGAQVVTGSVGKFHRKCSPCHAGPAILQQACLYLVAFSGEGALALGTVSCLDPASPRPRGPQAVPTFSLAQLFGEESLAGLPPQLCSPSQTHPPAPRLPPAVCQVVPDVSRSLSSSTARPTPSLAKWYRVWQPKLPPPMTTTSAVLGRGWLGPWGTTEEPCASSLRVRWYGTFFSAVGRASLARGCSPRFRTDLP